MLMALTCSKCGRCYNDWAHYEKDHCECDAGLLQSEEDTQDSKVIIELTDDEMETLRDAFNDVGCDCPGVDWAKFKALGVKFGFWEAEKPPTEEELKRREEFANSLLSKLTKEMFTLSNKHLMQEHAKDLLFTKGQQWSNSQLRIKLPNDYQVVQKEKK